MSRPPHSSHLAEIYDLYQWLQLQFHVLLMMGVKGARNMLRDLVVKNKIWTAYCCISLDIYNTD